MLTTRTEMLQCSSVKAHQLNKNYPSEGVINEGERSSYETRSNRLGRHDVKGSGVVPEIKVADPSSIIEEKQTFVSSSFRHFLTRGLVSKISGVSREFASIIAGKKEINSFGKAHIQAREEFYQVLMVNAMETLGSHNAACDYTVKTVLEYLDIDIKMPEPLRVGAIKNLPVLV